VVGTIQEPGPNGRRVGKNVKTLREAAGVTVRGLSARLGELGRPILASGVHKIEQGQRRVDSDELVALSLALDATPSRLLLTGEAGTEDLVPLAQGVAVPSEAAWRWACGEYQLFPLDAPTPMREVLAFRRANRPHNRGYGIHEGIQHNEALKPVAKAVIAALEQGVPFGLIREYVELVDRLQDIGD
jgi:transcriptional regulator with XRE-family HTH domain